MSFRFNKLYLLILLIVIGSFLRFYNLNWGAPFYFHPDERNIAASITGLQFPDQLNPKFFAYGSLPLYATYFINFFINTVLSCTSSLECSVKFEQAITTLRMISGIFSVLIIPLTYIIGERMKKGAGILAAALSTFSVGYIQFAHFGTVETLLTFFSLLLFFLLLRTLQSIQIGNSILIGMTLGVLIGIKVSSVALIILPVFAFLLSGSREQLLSKKVLKTIPHTALFLLTSGVVYFLTNPYTVLDSVAFRSSMDYEGGVVFGTILVFYTGEFFRTIPGLFQLTSIYPFLLNPFVTLFFLTALCMTGYKLLRKNNKELLLLLAFFFVLFIPQAILFAKWTRYMLPTLPFIYLLISIMIFSLHRSTLKITAISVLLISSVLFSLSYFITAFVEKNTLFQAAEFAKTSIPPSAIIASEVYDMGIVPFNQYLPTITLYNFYELDNKNPDYTPATLQSLLRGTDYIILPSQRVLKPRILNIEDFPIGHDFYSSLVHNTQGFTKVYESPCSVFCQITYLGDPVFRYEATANVFERPVVTIYKKQ